MANETKIKLSSKYCLSCEKKIHNLEEKQNSDHSGWLEVGCMKSGKDDPEKTQLLHTIEQHHSVALTLMLTKHSYQRNLL